MAPARYLSHYKSRYKCIIQTSKSSSMSRQSFLAENICHGPPFLRQQRQSFFSLSNLTELQYNHLTQLLIYLISMLYDIR